MPIFLILIIDVIITVAVMGWFMKSRTVDGKITAQVQSQAKILGGVVLILVGSILMQFKEQPSHRMTREQIEEMKDYRKDYDKRHGYDK